ncbi:MAG: TonB-dependent receptor [Pseudomonadota bacterium]
MKNKLSVSLFAIAAALAATANAQDGEPANSQSGENAKNGARLDQITISARRREENLQDTPVAVTALGGTDLAARSARNLQEIAQFVPTMISAKSPTGGAGGQYFLRGIGQSDYTVNLDPGVALYIDGVYYARVQGANLELMDVERVEVLRGPQGTLYGKNSTGGLINFVTRSPDAPESTSGKISLYSRDGIRGEFAFNREIADDVLYLGGAFTGLSEDGFADSFAMPTQASPMGLGAGDFGERELASGRLTLLFKPQDNLSFTLRGDLTEQSGSAQASVLRGVLAGAAPDRLISAEQRADLGDFDRTYNGFRAPNDLTSLGVSLTSTYDIGDVQLKSITAYRELEQRTGSDFDSTPFALADQRQNLDQDQISQELQLSGALFDERVNWLTGFFFLKEDILQELTVDGRGDPATLTSGTLQFQRIQQDNTSYGVFFNLDLAVTDQLTLSGAVRYSDEKKEIARLTQRFPDLDFDPAFALTLGDRLDDESWDQFTFKGGADYEVSDNLMVYASYSQGFRSGGFNIRPAPPDDDSFDPETVDAIEIGAKMNLFDNRVRVNLALFDNSYEDIQLLGREGVSIFTVNGGEGYTRGFELEVDAQVTEDFKANIGVGYLDTELEESTPSASAIGILAGNVLPFAPEWTLSGGLEYRFELPDSSALRARIDGYYRSDIFFTAANAAFGESEGYGLGNGRLSYERGDMTVSIFANNIFDERFWELLANNTTSPVAGFAFGVPSEPRRAGVEIGFDF